LTRIDQEPDMKTYLMALILLLWNLSLAAAEKPAQAEVGQQTRAALALQRGGQAASPTARPMSGEVAERTHRRYAESFSHPIPESFKEQEQEFVKDSN
jgi:hypothetical protein